MLAMHAKSLVCNVGTTRVHAPYAIPQNHPLQPSPPALPNHNLQYNIHSDDGGDGLGGMGDGCGGDGHSMPLFAPLLSSGSWHKRNSWTIWNQGKFQEMSCKVAANGYQTVTQLAPKLAYVLDS
jgi:hypothetical protein